MKTKAIFFMALLVGIANVWAVNPKRGYILTKEGKTVNGTVDYGTDNENAVTCRFMADGQSTYTAYTASQIKGYGIDEPVVKYRAESVGVEGRVGDYFLEQLIEGSYNLYVLRYGQQCYYIEKNGEFNQYPVAPKTTQEHVEKVIKGLIKDEGGSYVDYKQKSKGNARLHIHLMAGASVPATIHFDQIASALSVIQDEFACSAVQVPDVALGFDFALPRVSEGMYVQVQLSALPIDMACKAVSRQSKVTEFNYSLLLTDLQVGPSYRFTNASRWTPTVRAGMDVNVGFNTKTDYYNYDLNRSNLLTGAYGIYGGAGVDYALGVGALTLNADYTLRQYTPNNVAISNLSLRLGYRF